MLKEPPKNFDPLIHDALVLVHPTYSKERHPESYFHNLLAAVDHAHSANKPVFLVPDWSRFRRLADHLSKRKLIKVPNYLKFPTGVKRRVVRRRLQREVDFIADTLSKPPSKIRLGFAGIYASACVFSVAQSWCREVIPWWPKN